MTTRRTKKSTQALRKLEMAQEAVNSAVSGLQDLIDVNTDLVTWAIDLAISCGMPEAGANVTNAHSFIEARLTKAHNYAVDQLPEVFHTYPQIWVRGRQKTSYDDPGFAPLTVRAAQREHRQVIQLLVEAWPLASEEDRDIMTRDYLTVSSEQYKKAMDDFLYRTDSDLENELLLEIAKRENDYKFEAWSANNDKARRTNKRIRTRT
jgi:hypothetical protein